MRIKIIAFLIVLLEGGALLSYEVVSAKIYTPYIGSTIHVWTSILSITLVSLGLSYRFSHYFISKQKWFILPTSLFISGVYLFLLLFFKDSFLTLTANLEIKTASILSGVFLIFIPIFAMGLVTPTISAFLHFKEPKIDKNIGKISGYLYGLGTISGVLFTLFYIYLIIPLVGVVVTIMIIASTLFLSSILAYLIITRWK